MERTPAIFGSYEVGRLVAAHGWSSVFLAVDRRSGAKVAVKQLRAECATPEQEARLRREAELLARIDHPAIVRLIAFGVVDDARSAPYLVTEWLDGGTLSERLRRGPLSVEDALRLGARLADGLAAIHDLGIVHRDIKPQNIILVGGEPAQARLIDFGIAHTEDCTAYTLDKVLGTPSFSAPEQLSGEPVDGRTDLHGLGAVLFTALTGRYPFPGSTVGAVIQRVLMAPAPRVDALVGGVPPALAELIAALLAKAPRERPGDARAVAQALRAVRPSAGRGPRSPVGITTGEHPLRVVGLIHKDGAPVARRYESTGVSLEDVTEHLGRLHPGEGTAQERALRAAGAALELFAERPGTQVVIGIGRWDPEQLPDPLLNRVLAAPAGPPVVDARMAALLDGHHELMPDLEDTSLEWYRVGPRLRGARMGRGQLRPASLFLGREHELEVLMAAFHDCVERDRCRVLVVSGEAGIGKSRLAQELVHRLSERDAPPRILRARGDAVAAGAPLHLIRGLLQGAVGDGVELGHLSLPQEMAARLRVYLGHLIGAKPPSDTPAELREAYQAACQDPHILAANLGRAVLDWLEAELDVRPLVLLCEDVHWGDASSAALIERSERRFRSRPLFVVALTRPEPHLPIAPRWSARHAEVLVLPPLPDDVATSLVDRLDGGRLEPTLVQSIVARSAGNPLFLEELSRAALAGQGATPDTVIALLDAHFDRLSPTASAVACAGAVLGRRFTTDGLGAVLAGELAEGPIAESLDVLEDADIVRLNRQAWEFRHDLLVDAAYARLTEPAMRAAHARAARWLETAAPDHVAPIAYHWERAGRAELAGEWLVRAAESAFSTFGDVEETLAHAARAIACGIEGSVLGRVRLVQADAARWGKNDPALVVTFAAEAVELLEDDRDRFARASELLGWGCLGLGQVDRTAVAARTLRSRLDPSAPLDSELAALAWLATALTTGGRVIEARALIADIHQLVGHADRASVVTHGALHYCRATTGYVTGDLDAAFTSIAPARASFRSIGDLRNYSLATYNLALGYTEIGDFAAAAHVLDDLAGTPEDVLLVIGPASRGLRGLIETAIGDPAAGLLEVDRAREHEGEYQRSVFCSAWIRRHLLYAYFLADRLAEVASISDELMQICAAFPFERVRAIALAAHVALHQGQPRQALELVAQARTAPSICHTGYSQGLIDLAEVQALRALEDPGWAKTARDAVARFEAYALRLSTPRMRQTFRYELPEHQALARLAEAAA